MQKPLPIDIKPGPGTYEIFQHTEISYDNCLAELIDNSFDSFEMTEKDNGEISIHYDRKNKTIIYQDNGHGLSREELEKSLRSAESEKNKGNHKGLYGVGFNISLSKLGTRTDIYTKKQASDSWLHGTFDSLEMKSKQTFVMDLDYSDPGLELQLSEQSGLILKIQLRPPVNDYFSASQTIRTKLPQKIGQIYSYMLREEVPGLSGKYASNDKKKYKISINGELVQPYLPCIWSEERTVRRRKEDVHAVKYFEENLPDQKICNDCNAFNPVKFSVCNVCNSNKLTLKESKLWGWIGIQRYLDQTQFGLDYIRQGRKILINNKDCFNFEDTYGNVQVEYPVEMPKDMGRIVGEVHCDYLTPDLVKSSFEDDELFARTMRAIRGGAPLKPQSAKRYGEINNSPLAEMFNAFRRNEKGLVDLQIGSSKNRHGNTQVSQGWGKKFQDREPEYYTDEKWFVSAQQAQQEKDAAKEMGGKVTESGPRKTVDEFFSKTKKTSDDQDSDTKVEKTRNETIEELKETSISYSDFSGPITFRTKKNSVTELNVEAYKTEKKLMIDDIDSDPMCHIEQIDAKNYIIFVNTTHSEWKNINYENAILLKLFSLLKITLKDDNISDTDIIKILCETYAKKSGFEETINLHENTKSQIADAIIGAFTQNSSYYFDLLSDDEKKKLSSRPDVNVNKSKSDGSFVRYLTFNGISEIIEKKPEEFMDEKVFNLKYLNEDHTKNANKKTLGYIVNALKTLDNVVDPLANNYNYTDYEREQIKLSSNFLLDKLVKDGE